MTAVVADEAMSEDSASLMDWARSNLQLVVTPFVIIAAGALLFWYVSSTPHNLSDDLILNWDDSLKPQLMSHLKLTFASTILVLFIAIPLGIVLTRPAFRRLGGPVLSGASIGQAVPAYGLFVLFFMWLGQGFGTSIVVLTFFTILPVLLNTMVGIDQVDESVAEAAKGMGLTRLQVLRKIELPLAVPVILAGVRTALVINVGMAALAFLIGGGGLGITISAGLKLQRNLVIIAGAGLTAMLALTIDWLAAVAEKVLRPKGL